MPKNKIAATMLIAGGLCLVAAALMTTGFLMILLWSDDMPIVISLTMTLILSGMGLAGLAFVFDRPSRADN